MPEVQPNTIMDGWVHEVGRGSVFPSPDFWGRFEIFFDQDRRRRTLSHTRHPDQNPVRYYEPDEAEALIKEELAAHKRENPTFLLRVSEQNTLTVQPEKGRTRPVVELARHIGERHAKHSCILMNGDGFENPVLQQIQAGLRNRLISEFRDLSKRLIVPYAALESARLNLDTIRPIHITEDKRVGVVVKVPKLPKDVVKKNTPTSEKRSMSFEHNGRQYQTRWDYGNNIRFFVMHHAEFTANPAWHEITERIDEKKTGVTYWTVTESVHRLGSSIFSAEGPDGVRHRWLSSFDQNENPAMYFLAQLPDKGGIRYVTHAVRLLAPKIVQKAREDGRRVFRQGDIFAVETDLTDEDFASHTVAKRGRVFQGVRTIPAPNRPTWSTAEIEIPILADEARTNLKLRRSIMIYGTGHTASSVVQTPNGTYVKGWMFHDPILENIRANRNPEHAQIALGDGTKWFLCCRNTVPRMSNSSDSVTPTSENARGTVLGEGSEDRRVLAVARS